MTANLGFRSWSAAIGLAIALLIAAPLARPSSTGYAHRSEVQSFIRDLVERHGLVEQELLRVFALARRQEGVLQAIRPLPPTRARSWQTYRSTFVNPQHKRAGAAFLSKHSAALARASREYGVPPEIIVAIIGVETFYGRNTGRWRVVDALTTLAFDYPPRSDFFRAELESYLLLAREADMEVLSLKGSYAGAMGIPQFMPSSQRRFAIDFDGSGRVDLHHSATDAIGSVANFLKQHGWRGGEPVFVPANFAGEGYREMLAAGILPSFDATDLKRFGIELRAAVPEDARVALVELESPAQPYEYRIGLNNFYVLTRYNRSAFYASAVNDLAEAIRQSGDSAAR